MANQNGKITAPVNTDDVVATLGENSHNFGVLCTSTRINKRSRFKPYPFGSYDTVLTDALLRDMNFSMTPECVGHKVGGGFGAYMAMPWKQWQAPDKQTGWMRLADFDGYYHYAGGGVFDARISTNYPHDDRIIMLGGLGKGRITGDISFSFDTSTEVCPHEFSHPTQTNHPLSAYYFTLLFGAVEGNEDSFRNRPWVAQSSRTIAEMTGAGSHSERLSIMLDNARSQLMKGSENDLDCWLAVLCLAPKIETNDEGQYMRVRDNFYSSSSLDFSEMRLISLDMWDDGSISTDSVLFSMLENMKDYTTPADLKIVEIGVTPDPRYFTTPSIGWKPFVCDANGWVYRSNGAWQLVLSCDPFPTIYFPAGAIINDLAQYLEYEIRNTSGMLMHSGEILVSEVHRAAYNPTNTQYSISFDDVNAEGYEVPLPSTLPSGKYKLRLRCRAQQTKVDINYNPEPPQRQLMGQLSYEYEDDEYFPYFDAEGVVYSEYINTEITIS